MSETRTDEPTGTPTTTWGMYSSQILSGIILGVLGAGTIVYKGLEGWGWIDSFYFSVITLTTVGYGDLTPSSPESKLFTSVYIITGISLLGAALNETMKRRSRRVAARRAERNR